MKEIIDLLSRFLFADLMPLSKPVGLVYTRLMANLGAFFFLVFGYVLGCRALYHYLEPMWGDVLSLLALCGLLIVTSCLLFLVGWLLKPKKPPVTDFISAMEKIAGGLPSGEIVKKIISHISPKTLLAVFTIAAVGSCLSHFKKKDI
jgi:hypothetical protein